MKKVFLTKSRFKVGCECPTKLYYLDNKEYGNNSADDSFLKALAEGGFQVGELAKAYHPDGTEITTIDKDKAAAETAELLRKDKVVIYEASFKFENLFVKTDVVVKNGNEIELIEVKAKSYDSEGDGSFFNKRKGKDGKQKISSAWEPYVLDIAFQTWVFQKAFPQFKTKSFLLLADKSKKASVSGINQKFFLDKDENGRAKVVVERGLNKKDLGVPLLAKIDADEAVAVAMDIVFENGKPFPEMVNYLSDLCEKRKMAEPVISSGCKSCEFRIGKDLQAKGLKSGFEECWTRVAKLKKEDFAHPFVFELWNFRKSNELLEEKKYFLHELKKEDVEPTPSEKGTGLSNSERQWLQVEKCSGKDKSPYLDLASLKDLSKEWKFPLHFIDFETTMVAIPFHKGRRPYEQIAFQFSHHQLNEDGTIVHRDEYINRKQGMFPNFEFVRELKKALSRDEGTIFRYANHENSVLCQIHAQLMDTGDEVRDGKELMVFIESITKKDKGEFTWNGKRNMVDLLQLVQKYFYHPLMKGSNSIKKVLPAVLEESKFLKEKYSKPIYGAEIQSKNFKNHIWIEMDAEGKVKDPYKRLEPIFNDIDLSVIEDRVTEGSIADGGSAMTAYARMQFTQMSSQETERVAKALLKYCELDTLAMVMIYEYWMQEIKASGKRGKAA